jgi:hypothetical protein
VTVYVTLDGVGEVKERVTCDFTSSSFDLKVCTAAGSHCRRDKRAG